MPNREEHMRDGGLAGALVAFIGNARAQAERLRLNPGCRHNLAELIAITALGYGAGRIAGRLPDLLEPPVHPGHRDVCHSALAGMLVVAGAKKINDNPMVSAPVKTAANALATGYVVHLLADGQTPAGIPWVTRK